MHAEGGPKLCMSSSDNVLHCICRLGCSRTPTNVSAWPDLLREYILLLNRRHSPNSYIFPCETVSKQSLEVIQHTTLLFWNGGHSASHCHKVIPRNLVLIAVMPLGRSSDVYSISSLNEDIQLGGQSITMSLARDWTAV